MLPRHRRCWHRCDSRQWQACRLVWQRTFNQQERHSRSYQHSAQPFVGSMYTVFYNGSMQANVRGKGGVCEGRRCY